MCVGSPTAGAWSSFQRRPDDEFETDSWHELVTRADRQARVTLSVVGHVGPAELGHGLKDFRPGEARASALLLAADGGLRGSVACDNNLSP